MMKYSTRWLLKVLAALILSLAANSCGNDEPELPVGYYLSIHSQVMLDLSDNDENQGTAANMTSNVISVTIKRMKK